MFEIHTYMYMPPLTIVFYNNCKFGSNFTCCGFKIVFLKKFLDRSASLFGQETHEHVETIKKLCLETKNTIFINFYVIALFCYVFLIFCEILRFGVGKKSQGLLGCFWDFGSNIKVVGQNNLIFELLPQK